MSPPVAVLRYREDGGVEMYAFGEEGAMRFLVIDEGKPHDRVFEITARIPIEQLDKLIQPGEPIGNREDPRHAALMARAEAARRGDCHLEAVE